MGRPGSNLDRLRAWAVDSPVNLAVVRITVGLVFLNLPDLHTASRWAALPGSVRTPVWGIGWTLDVVPISEPLADVAYVALLVGLGCGVVGLMSRLSYLVVTVASLYLLAIPQLSGAAFHYHHLVWFSALLAASPCGDALSVDRLIARRRGRPAPRPDLAYGLPLRAAWLLVGMIFFFPGLWKLLESGVDWFWSDNLRNQMYAKWMQKDFTPLFRVDRYPLLVKLGALSVVIFELSFLPMVLFRRTRPWAVGAALVFHQLTAYLMGLRFPALWMCYVMFIDWAGLAAWIRRRLGRPAAAAPAGLAQPDRRWPVRSAAVVGALLVIGNLVAGAAGISDGWPFACYPKFHRTAAARMPALEVELVDAEGGTRIVPAEHLVDGGRTQRYWALTWSLMGAHETARASPEKFAAFWRGVADRPQLRRDAADAVAVRFYHTYVSTIPEDRDRPPLSRRLLYELQLAPND